MNAPAPATNRALPTTAAQLGLGIEPLVARKNDPLVTHLRAAIDGQLRVIIERQQGLRSVDEPEDVHQLRVAVRRLRAILREEGAVLGEVASSLRDELKWLATAFGEVRDLDVLIEGLTNDAAALPEPDREAFDAVLAAFAARRSEARKVAMRTLRTARYRKLLQALADTLQITGHTGDGAPERSAAPGELIRKPYRKLRKDIAKIGEVPTDDELHDLRIRGKRLRYSAEFCRPRNGKQAKRTQKLIKATKRMQTVLGDHNDSVVAEQRLRHLLAEEQLDTPAMLAAGRLIERHAEQRARHRVQWRREWANVDKRARALL
ncbi:MAG: CHAD domain-containing protein [Pseudonocardiaceae bacterium]|nr:CHAD domain-containing protein [Pseudonocardiaceae bacterium]